MKENIEKKAKIVVISGIDFSGKGSLIKRLKTLFKKQGFNIRCVIEPGGDPDAQAIREMLLDKERNIKPGCEMYLYFASRAQLFESLIPKFAKKYDLILFDRSGYSTHAYQGGGRGLDIETIQFNNKKCYGNHHPDLCIILSITIDTLIKRRSLDKTKKHDRMDLQVTSFYERVIESYQSLPSFYPECVLIDANGTKEETLERALGVLKDRLGIIL